MNRKAIILFGSPHKNGATNEITAWAEKRLLEKGFESERIYLYEKKINPCIGCAACQKTDEAFGCAQKDDVVTIAEKVLEADLILLATPIHGCYCSAPLKTLLDRLTYIMNKYIGRKPDKWHCLWDSKHLGLLIAYAVKYDDMLVPLDLGTKLFCLHSKLFYDGYCAVHRKNFMLRKESQNEEEFGDKEQVDQFMDHLINECEEEKIAVWSAFTGK